MVTFTEEILNGKLHFSCSAKSARLYITDMFQLPFWSRNPLDDFLSSLYMKKILFLAVTQPKKLDFESSKHNQILCAKLLFLFGGCNSCVKGANCLNLGQGLEVVLFNFLSQSCRTVALYYTQYYSKIF